MVAQPKHEVKRALVAGIWQKMVKRPLAKIRSKYLSLSLRKFGQLAIKLIVFMIRNMLIPNLKISGEN